MHYHKILHCCKDNVELKLPCILIDPQKYFNPGLLNIWRNMIKSPLEYIMQNDQQKYLHLCTVDWCALPSIRTNIMEALNPLNQR